MRLKRKTIMKDVRTLSKYCGYCRDSKKRNVKVNICHDCFKQWKDSWKGE